MDFIGSYSSSDSEEPELCTPSTSIEPPITTVTDDPPCQPNPPSTSMKYDHVTTKSTKRPSTFSVNTNKTSIKPYIPKSKRTKLLNDTTQSGKESSSIFKTCTNLSPMFEKARQFTKVTENKIPRDKTNLFKAHEGSINKIMWNPKFADILLSASMDSVVKLWNVQTSPCCMYMVTNHGAAVKDASWDSSGLHILSGGYDNMVHLTDVNTEKQLCALKHDSFVTSVKYHPVDNNVCLAGTSNDGIFAWDLRTQEVVMKYKSYFGQIQDMVFLPDGQSFISAAEVLKRNSTDKGIMVWDYKTSTVLSNQVFQEVYTCTSLRVHPRENVFLAQCNADYIAIFSQKPPYKLNKYKRYEGHKVSGYHVGFDLSSDGSLVVTGSSDGIIHIYNYKTCRIVKTMKMNAPCLDVCWSRAHETLLASCDWQGCIQLHR